MWAGVIQVGVCLEMASASRWRFYAGFRLKLDQVAAIHGGTDRSKMINKLWPERSRYLHRRYFGFKETQSSNYLAIQASWVGEKSCLVNDH